MATTPSADAVGDLTDLGLGRAGGRVLVVGDGNFSFARAFLRANAARVAAGDVTLTATSLDARAQLLRMYPSADQALEQLAAGGARVEHEVDATQLGAWAARGGGGNSDDDDVERFDRVVFNFPHFAAGGAKRNKIHRHRQLLREFFASACDVLARDGLVWVTLCAGQGGTPMDPKPRAWGDTWQVVHCAADAGLVLRDAHLCPVARLAALGYHSVGYKLRERGFWTPASVSHVFCREDVGVTAPFPIAWTRAISFWTHAGFSEALVVAALRASFPPPMTLSFALTDAYACPRSGRASATYAFTVACAHSAFSKQRVNARTAEAMRRLESSGFASSRAE